MRELVLRLGFQALANNVCRLIGGQLRNVGIPWYVFLYYTYTVTVTVPTLSTYIRCYTQLQKCYPLVSCVRFGLYFLV